MLKVVDFIKSHPINWVELLNEKGIGVKEDGNYMIFHYDGITADFSDEIVRECRGVILRKDNLKVVSLPFLKFASYGQGEMPNGENIYGRIDWSTARVQEKTDGSMIQVWEDEGKWHVSTSNMIDASKALAKFGKDDERANFKDIFDEAAKNHNLDITKLTPGFTYVFELVSPYNRVVINYPTASLVHTTTRCMEDLQEVKRFINVPQPEEFNIYSLEDAVEYANSLPWNKEGFVVVDDNWNRVKVKSRAYVTVHHIHSDNPDLKVERPKKLGYILEAILNGEIEELTTYLPNTAPDINKINEGLNNIEKDINDKIADIVLIDNKKDLSKYLNGNFDKALHHYFYSIFGCDEYPGFKTFVRTLNKSSKVNLACLLMGE